MVIMSKSWFEQMEEYELENRFSIQNYIESISKKIKSEFEEYDKYHPAILGIKNGQNIYDLIRTIKPAIVVETGVCNGFSSSIILKAMEKNDRGELYSVDLPVRIDEIKNDGRTGAVLPPGKDSGWAVPDDLRKRWNLYIGNTYEKLPEVFEDVPKKIDFFLHDSDHSYETMMFEFALAWYHLKKKGFVVADNVTFSWAFYDFTERKELDRFRLGEMGLTKKI